MIALEEVEERGLGAGGAFDAAKPQRADAMQQLFGIEREILHPECHALSYRRELRRLEVRVREAGKSAVTARGFPHGDEERANAAEQQLHRLAHQDEVRVVGHIGARRAEVNEGARCRRLIAKVMDMCHHIVAQAALVLRRLLEIGVVEMRVQLRERGVRNVEAQLLLAFHQRQP